MLKSKLLSMVCLSALAVPVGWSAAVEPTAAQPTAAQAATKSDKDVKTPSPGATADQLIEQLDAADFAKRETACGDLAAKGKDAIPAWRRRPSARS